MATLLSPLLPDATISRAPGRDDLAKRWPLPLVGLLFGGANIDETGDALVAGKRKGLAHAFAISAPLGDPLRAVAERRGGENEILAGGAGREDLLPFRRCRVLHHARDHGDNQGRAQEPPRLVFEPEGTRVRFFLAADLGEDVAECGPRLALEQEKAPGHEFLVVGHARGCLEDQLNLYRARPWLSQSVGGNRATGKQEVYGRVRHVPRREGVVKGRVPYPEKGPRTMPESLPDRRGKRPAESPQIGLIRKGFSPRCAHPKRGITACG